MRLRWRTPEACALTHSLCAAVPDGDVDVLRAHNHVAGRVELTDVLLAPDLQCQAQQQGGYTGYR